MCVRSREALPAGLYRECSEASAGGQRGAQVDPLLWSSTERLATVRNGSFASVSEAANILVRLSFKRMKNTVNNLKLNSPSYRI